MKKEKVDDILEYMYLYDIRLLLHLLTKKGFTLAVHVKILQDSHLIVFLSVETFLIMSLKELQYVAIKKSEICVY